LAWNLLFKQSELVMSMIIYEYVVIISRASCGLQSMWQQFYRDDDMYDISSCFEPISKCHGDPRTFFSSLKVIIGSEKFVKAFKLLLLC
jgi:hypothetical protein